MGVSVTVAPGRPGLPALPLPWRGGRRPAGRGGLRELSPWALAGVLLALLLAAGGTAATVAAAPSVPPSVACAPKSAGTVAGLSPAQRENATRIIAVGKSMGASPRAQVVALATAMQESTLVNNPGGDRDSAGLFQQRPSQGWGTYRQVTDPTFSSRTFYTRLLKVPGWDRMPVTVAAQTVQRSAFPDAYAKHEPVARALVSGTACQSKT